MGSGRHGTGVGVSLSTVQRWERQGGEPTRLARRELKKLFKEAGIDGDEESQSITTES